MIKKRQETKKNSLASSTTLPLLFTITTITSITSITLLPTSTYYYLPPDRPKKERGKK